MLSLAWGQCGRDWLHGNVVIFAHEPGDSKFVEDIITEIRGK